MVKKVLIGKGYKIVYEDGVLRYYHLTDKPSLFQKIINEIKILLKKLLDKK